MFDEYKRGVPLSPNTRNAHAPSLRYVFSPLISCLSVWRSVNRVILYIISQWYVVNKE